MDGIEPEVLQEGKAAAETVPGVLDAELAGRWTGRTLRLDVEARLDPGVTIAEAEDVGRRVEAAVLDAVEEARQVRFIPRPEPSNLK
jgi:divalent metal cation (Fe/Co/Zn/Cd) transporter